MWRVSVSLFYCQVPVAPAPSPEPTKRRKGEFTLEEARKAIRLRAAALRGDTTDNVRQFIELSTPEMLVLNEASLKIAIVAAATMSGPERDSFHRAWLQAERKLAELRARRTDIAAYLELTKPGATVSIWRASGHGHKSFDGTTGAELAKAVDFPEDVIVSLTEMLGEAGLSKQTMWIGPLPFEHVPPKAMADHKVYLQKGQAWLPLYYLSGMHLDAEVRALQSQVSRKGVLDNPDARAISLMNSWRQQFYRPTKKGPGFGELPSNLPACMKQLLNQDYPDFQRRMVTTNILAHLGVKNIAQTLVKGWSKAIKAKHGEAKLEAKKKEIATSVDQLARTYKNASYNCQWLCVHGLCPLKRAVHQETLKACFGEVPKGESASPAAFVRARNGVVAME